MGCGTIFAICTRFNILLLSSVAIGGSLFTTFSCQFFTYKALDGVVWEGLEGPFQDLPEASVGLFSYSESATTSTAVFGDACERFNDWRVVGQSDVFQVAQIAAITAPFLGFLAWCQVLFEFLCCRLYGGFVLMSALFLLAAAAQACTFLVFADTQFCLEPESVNDCQFELGAYYSFGAMIVYTIMACLVSNAPPSPGQRSNGCLVYTGWKSSGPNKESSSHPLEISTHNQVDPEMARSLESKETHQVEQQEQAPRSVNDRPMEDNPEDAAQQPETPDVEAAQAAESEILHNEKTGTEEEEEIIEEEVMVMTDENGQQVVVEEEIVEEEVVEVEEEVPTEQPPLVSEGGDQPTSEPSKPEAEAPNV